MAKKIRQITDSIHQTVFLSELESQMMSTPYFYRLHDIYQSSTVYLSFPCNRTKRYEHSCGVMYVAGKIISSAITNSDEKTLDKFFDDVEKHFSKILETFVEDNNPEAVFCKHSGSRLGECFIHYDGDKIVEISKEIADNLYKTPHLISDTALSHYFPPIYKDVEKRRFLYQLVLEAVRLTALFHDVGHPPFSHIIESELINLYSKCSNSKNSYDSNKVKFFNRCLSSFIGDGKNKVRLLLGEGTISSALHEVIGLQMFNLAFDDMLDNMIKDNANLGYNSNEKMAIESYYVALGEFCNSIMCEKDDFYISLHRIIDGCIDADRMDYVVRDTLNSGVNWGGVPYKRILESSRLSVKETNEKLSNGTNKNHTFYIIAFHRKMVEDIDDFLLTRYKIFSRVNYHHKSFKTGLILQKIIRELVRDYLSKSNNENVLCPEIKNLWGSLWISQNTKALNVIQWNDSTLIANLYKTLVDMNEHVDIENGVNTYYKISEIRYKKILNLLEEFLLNQKHYQAVFKRPSDLTTIMENVINNCSEYLENVIEYEKEKEKGSASDEDYENAKDSLTRLANEQFNIVRASGDINAFENIFALDLKFDEIIKKTLDKFKNDKIIISYFFDINTSWEKLGLPNKNDYSDGIYLYNSKDEKVDLYNTKNLEKQLLILQKYCLKYIAYIYPLHNENTTNIVNDILNDIEKSLSEQLISALQQNFTDIIKMVNTDY